MNRLALLLTGVVFGCAAAPEQGGGNWLGKSEADAREAYASVASDTGVLYWGGAGARRLYFALVDGTQVWFGLDGAGTVMMVGGPEPKTRWVRYDGDSIDVEGVR